MNSAVCTLFENHYHYGVAALTNSLYRHGFRGSIYAGYRGSLPSWSSDANPNPLLNWKDSLTLTVTEGLYLHFLPIQTEFHLTNYKPDFMISLWEGPAKDAESLAYFDPDIVIKCRWSFYENWMSHGVALVHEITSNDMPSSHPIRLEWEKVIMKENKKITHQPSSYINGGFCGVSKQNFNFLKIWSEIIASAIKDFKPNPTQFMTFDRTYPFFSVDQDALNVTAMCTETCISEIGPEGMDLIYGGWTMSHAVGSPKPWRKSFFIFALKGKPPSLAEKAYWLNIYGPIKCHNLVTVKIKQVSILLATFIGRFYSRY
jgi:hypothetical protein